MNKKKKSKLASSNLKKEWKKLTLDSLNNRPLFLRWVLLAVVAVCSSLMLINTGLYNRLVEGDVTRISFLILIGFFGISAKIGMDTYNLSKEVFKGDPGEEDRLKHYGRELELGWFSADIFMGMGMVGTVCGFIMMLATFLNVDVENVNNIKSMLAVLGGGMSTALYTTLVGLICSMLVKLQCMNTEYELNKEVDKFDGNTT